MPERREASLASEEAAELQAASLSSETTEQRPAVIEWGTFGTEGSNFVAQSGDNLVAQSGDNLEPQSG